MTAHTNRKGLGQGEIFDFRRRNLLMTGRRISIGPWHVSLGLGQHTTRTYERSHSIKSPVRGRVARGWRWLVKRDYVGGCGWSTAQQAWPCPSFQVNVGTISTPLQSKLRHCTGTHHMHWNTAPLICLYSLWPSSLYHISIFNSIKLIIFSKINSGN